jgi:hypothetical protein
MTKEDSPIQLCLSAEMELTPSQPPEEPAKTSITFKNMPTLKRYVLPEPDQCIYGKALRRLTKRNGGLGANKYLVKGLGASLVTDPAFYFSCFLAAN